MKKGIHPNYHPITIKMADGSKIETRSTWGKEGAELKPEIDMKNHPAWTGGPSVVNQDSDKVKNFLNRFKGIDFFADDKKKAAAVDTPKGDEASA